MVPRQKTEDEELEEETGDMREGEKGEDEIEEKDVKGEEKEESKREIETAGEKQYLR